MAIIHAKQIVYPEYMSVIFDDRYDNDVWCEKMNRRLNCQIRSFFQYDKLLEALLEEISLGQRVCQFGVTFGHQIERIAKRIGKFGYYDIIDVNENVVERAKAKFEAKYEQLNVIHNNVAYLKPVATYDAVICPFILSMMPLSYKKNTINNALKMLKPGGKVIFVDWHKPNDSNLLKFPVKFYNRLYNPFVEQLWESTIRSIACNGNTNFIWKTRLYFGGMFQKTIAKRKE